MRIKVTDARNIAKKPVKVLSSKKKGTAQRQPLKRQNGLAQKRIVRSANRSKSGQKNGARSVQKQKASKQIKKKKDPVQKKKTLKVKSEKDNQRDEKKQMLQQKNQKREQAKLQKQIKAKLFDIEPNNKVEKIDYNPITETPFNVKQAKNKQKRDFDLKGCCTYCNNREVIQCVKYEDIDGLKKCLKDLDHISNPFQFYSLNCQEDAFIAALKSKNQEIIKILLKYVEQAQKGKITRTKLPSVNLEKMGTGTANRFQFYFPIRKVQLSRGGKEGNNAFTHDSKMRKNRFPAHNKIYKYQPSVSIVKLIQMTKLTADAEDEYDEEVEVEENEEDDDKNFKALNISYRDLKEVLGKVTRTGNYDLLKFLMKGCVNNHGYGFNKLHTSSILQGQETNTLKNVTKASLLKKAYDVFTMMPMHMAAINPDITILKKYFKVYPTIMQQDAQQRDIVHYAAANHNSDALEFLISKNVDINNRDMKGITPLMLACKLGRTENVAQIIDEQKRQLKQLDEKDEDYNHYQNFYKFSNSQGPYKRTPLHIAAELGHFKIVKLLVEDGEADIEAKDFYSNTPLSSAAEHGYLSIVEYLLDKGAQIHGQDKQRRSPLLRACKNGQIHVVSFLLRKGVNPNFRDSSDNTALHYACAYGWLNVVRLLIEAGADPNVQNEWKTSAILIAMLKGHFGIVDYLINLDNLNASFQDDQGRTLIAQLCLNFNEDSAKNLKHLLETKKIDATIKDVMGMSPLHHLAGINIQQLAQNYVKNKDKKEKIKEESHYYRQGKKIKRSNYSRYERNEQNRDDKIIGFFVKEEDKKEYTKKLKELEDSMLKCAVMLIKEGLSVQDISEEGQMTPLFVAIMCQNYVFAKWLLEKDPTAISGKIKSENKNILHLLSKDFIIFEENLSILQQLVKGNKNTLKDLAFQEDDEGIPPYLNYFIEAKTNVMDLLQANSYYGGNMTDEGKTHVKNVMIPRIVKQLIEIQNIYANQFNYDITSQIGLVKDAKKKLEKVFENELITKEEYRLLKSLQYDFNIHGKKKDKMEIDDEKKSNKFKYDDLQTFNPKKQKMGLLEEAFSKDSNAQSQIVKTIKKRRIHSKKALKRQNQAKLDNLVDKNIIQIEAEEYELRQNDFYTNVDCKKNCLQLLIPLLKDLGASEKHHFLQLFKESFKNSKKFIQKNDPSYQQGFNKSDLSCENILFQLIKTEYGAFVQVAIETDLIDLNLQSSATKLGVLHLISNTSNREIIDTILKFIKKIDINQTDKFQNTPLHYAAYNRNLFTIEQLLKNGAKINATNKYGYNALHLSLFAFDMKKDHTPRVETFLMDQGINVNQVDEDQRTPIFYIFFKQQNNGNSSIDPANVVMSLLQNQKLKINVQDKNLYTPLHYACQQGATISSLQLINFGADINLKNIKQNTPLGEAGANKKVDLCIFLIQNGCKANEQAKYLKQQSEDSNKQSFKNVILSESIIQKGEDQQFAVYKDQKDLINQKFKVKDRSIFDVALENNSGGLCYYLLSKQVDTFDALYCCLKFSRFEMFLDLLENEKAKNVQRSDAKQRNLIFRLIQSLADAYGKDEQDGTDEDDEDNNDDDESSNSSQNSDGSPKKPKTQKLSNIITKGLEILDLLVTKYNVDITQSNNKNVNILHLIAEQEKFTLFDEVVKRLNKAQLNKLLSQKKDKNSLQPLLHFIEDNNLADDRFKKYLYPLFKKVNYKQYDFKFVQIPKESKYKNTVNVPDHFFADRLFPISLYQEKGLKTTAIHDIIERIDDSKSFEKLKEIISNLEKLFDLNELDPELGLSILSVAILLNKQNVARILLGFDEENAEAEKKIVPHKSANAPRKSINFKSPKQKKNGKFIAKEKPKVNVNLQDKQGKTALHYAIKPTDYGLWMNQSVIEMLFEAKANPNLADKKGFSCIDYAQNSPIALQILQEYFPNAKSNKKIVQVKSNEKEVQPFQMNGKKIDYFADAEFFFKEHLDKLKNDKMADDEEARKKLEEVVVDKVSKLEKACIVVKDDELQLHFDVLMVKLDVKKHMFGTCNFYVIQLLFDKVKNIYILWTRWGRIGDEGQYQRTPFGTRDEAEKEFKKVLKQKSGATWADIKSFVPVPKKYNIKRVSGKIIYQSKEEQKWKFSDRQIEIKDFLVDFDTYKQVKSRLSEQQLQFMQTAVNQAHLVRKANNNSLQKDLFLSSLLEPETLDNLRDVLQKIEDLIELKEKARSKRDYEQFEEYMTQIFDLSNEYYEGICPVDFAFSSMKFLDRYENVQREMDKLQIIYDFEHTTKLLFGAIHRIKDINPYDYCFNALFTKLQQIDEDSQEYKLLARYINCSTQTGLVYHYNKNNSYIKNVFSLQADPALSKKTKQQIQKGEETFNTLHNHLILFHGTSNANLLSIIEKGMMITPQNSSRLVGSRFGKGIYFADMFTFAQNYSDHSFYENTETNGDYFILVCEVALGNVCNDLSREYGENKSLPRGYDSLRMMGRHGPDFERNLIRDDGSIWPLGQIVNYQGPVIKKGEEEFTNYNEFIKSKKPEKEENKKKAGKKASKSPNKRSKSKEEVKKEKDDVIMIDTSTKNKQPEEEKKKQDKDKEDEFEVPIQPNIKKYKIEPHIIHKIKDVKHSNYLHYSMQEAQYVVFNPEQVKVRYVIHLSK